MKHCILTEIYLENWLVETVIVVQIKWLFKNASEKIWNSLVWLFGFFFFYFCVSSFFLSLGNSCVLLHSALKSSFSVLNVKVFCPLAPSCRQRHHWTGRNWLWENRSLCFANSSSTAGNTSAIICSCPHTNKRTGLSNLRAVWSSWIFHWCSKQ